jgi:hypothetical protein
MAKRDIFSIACKILGLYMLVRTVESFQYAMMGFAVVIGAPGFSLFSLSRMDSRFWQLAASNLAVLFFAAASFCLIVWADDIAKALCAGEESSEIKGALDKDTLQQIALITAGVFVIAHAFSIITQAVFRMLYVSAYARTMPDFFWSDLLSHGVELAIGVYLVLGAKGLVKVISNLRRA